jgi:putative ABC transport system ATP-binding protein
MHSTHPDYQAIDILPSSLQQNPFDEKEELKDVKDIIVLKNVHKTYLLGVEGVTALRGVSLNIKQGEFVCILGTSGGGKTTMLNIIGTIDKPTKGEVFIAGHKIKASTEDKLLASLRLHYLAFVFQTFNLLSSLTAVENVELPMILEGKLGRSESRRRAIMLLEKVGLKERVNHFPNQLSGGEQQRVTIARALSNNPKILLLDEPTGDLDTKNTDLIMKIIVDLNRDGITVVMVTHDIALKNFANRVVRMLDGKIHKIEEHSEESRNEHVFNLTQVCNQYLEIDRATGESQSNLGVREGTKKREGLEGLSYHSLEDIAKPKYEVRKPTDYAAIAFAKK